MPLYEKIKAFTAPPPLADEEENRIAGLLNLIEITTMIALCALTLHRLLTGYLYDVLALLIISGSIFFSIIVLHRKKVYWSGLIGLWCMLAFIIFQSWNNDGIRDIVLFAIPGVLIVAGLVLKQRDYLILSCTALLSLGIIGFLEVRGIKQNLLPSKTNWNDILDLEVMIGITSLVIWLLSKSLRKNIERLQKDEKEIRIQSEQLKISERRYRTLFEGASNAIFILSYDKFIGCNSMALRMFECEISTDIIGHFIHEFCPLKQSDGKNSEEKIIEYIHLVLEGKPQRFNWRFSRSNGQTFDSEMSLSLLDDSNDIFIQALITDMTERVKAEEALRKSDEKLRGIVDNITNLFYSCGEDLKFTYLSPQSKDIFENEPEDPILCFSDLTTDNPINRFGIESARKAIATGEPQPSYELELLNRKGSRVWLEIQERPVVQNDKVISLVGVATDITKRKWTERALQISEKKYRDIVTWAPVGIYQSTRSGKLLSANSSIAKMLGYSNADEFVGCDMGKEIYYDERDRDRFIAQHDKIGQNVSLSSEARWKKRDGSILWVLMTVHDIRDKTGQILYYEGFVFDITERKQAEEALRESEERFRLLVENSSDLVTEIGADGEFLYVSPNVKTILDYRPVDLEGTNVLSKVYSKDKEQIEKILNKQGGNATYRYRDRAGNWHWFESSVRVYDTSSGERRMVMVSRDITQRRKAEQELEVSRKQLQHFTEHLEHVLEEERRRISRELHDDLGQLLTILKFDLSWLRLEGTRGEPDIIAKIDTMMESLNEALASVKRISKEVRPPQLDALGLSGALKWDIDQVEKKIGIKGVVTIEPPDFEVKGDVGTVLYRIFREALTNIVRHSQAQNVNVRLAKNKDCAVLSIRDDGRGISKKELKGETSLGLVGIRERTRMVGGTLTIDGKPGEGTLVSVEIPLEKKKNGENEQ